jgi:hypothetical protein
VPGPSPPTVLGALSRALGTYGFERLGDGSPGQFTRVGDSGVLMYLRAEPSRGRLRLIDGVALPSFVEAAAESSDLLAELLLWDRYHAYWPLERIAAGRPARLTEQYADYLGQVVERLLPHDCLARLRDRILGVDDDNVQRVRYAIHLSRLDGDTTAEGLHRARLDRLIREAVAGGAGLSGRR